MEEEEEAAIGDCGGEPMVDPGCTKLLAPLWLKLKPPNPAMPPSAAPYSVRSADSAAPASSNKSAPLETGSGVEGSRGQTLGS